MNYSGSTLWMMQTLTLYNRHKCLSTLVNILLTTTNNEKDVEMDPNELWIDGGTCVEKRLECCHHFRFHSPRWLCYMTPFFISLFLSHQRHRTPEQSHSHCLLAVHSTYTPKSNSAELCWNVIFIQAHRNIDTFCVLCCINKTRLLPFCNYNAQLEVLFNFFFFGFTSGNVYLHSIHTIQLTSNSIRAAIYFIVRRSCFFNHLT